MGSFVIEILKTESYFKRTPQGNMICNKPKKVRLKYVNEFEEGEILHRNWQMIRPWFACCQDHLVESMDLEGVELP
jgi:hypothetical protein